LTLAFDFFAAHGRPFVIGTVVHLIEKIKPDNSDTFAV
jgi:hypothetical protein